MKCVKNQPNLQTSAINNSRILKSKTAKFSGYYFYINTNMQKDFQICISVPLRSSEKIKSSTGSLKSLSQRLCQPQQQQNTIVIKASHNGHMSYKSIYNSSICVLYVIKTPNVRSIYNGCQLILLILSMELQCKQEQHARKFLYICLLNSAWL